MASRLMVARWMWYLYGAAYPLLVFVALSIGMRTLPLLAGVPLLVVVALSAGLVWPLSRRLLLPTLGAASLQVTLGVLLLGGPGTSVLSGGRAFVDPPGLPAPLQVPALLFGAFLPPLIVFHSLRALRARRTVTPRA